MSAAGCVQHSIYLLSQHTVCIVWHIAKSLTIVLLSVVERQKRCYAKFPDLVHEIIKGNIK